jgi:hypothetical protein
MPFAAFALVQLQKLGAQEHNIDIDHCILLNITILARKLRHPEQLVREAKEIELHPNIN